MKLFYTPTINSNIIWLTEEDSRHCLKSLRLKKGDSLNITDGKGILCDAEINDENLKACSVRIINTYQEYNKRNFKLNIAIAPTKNINRFEWFLEKCTEIGIDEITPVICEHSERRNINIERSEKILITAMKQSCIAFLPKINPIIEFKEFLLINNSVLNSQLSSDLSALPLSTGREGLGVSTISLPIFNSPLPANKFIAVCDDYDNKKHLKDICLRTPNSELPTTILIGPEGDFSPEEVKLAFENGYKPVSLSVNRLRTETAGVVACTIANLINEV